MTKNVFADEDFRRAIASAAKQLGGEIDAAYARRTEQQIVFLWLRILRVSDQGTLTDALVKVVTRQDVDEKLREPGLLPAWDLGLRTEGRPLVVGVTWGKDTQLGVVSIGGSGASA